jgi:hypothetical protein
MRSQHLRGVLSGFFGQDICFQCFSEGGGLQNPLPIGLRRRFLSAEGLEPRPSHLFHCFPFQLFNSSGDFDISYAVCSPRERAQIYCAPKGEITCKSGGAFLSFVLLGLGGKWEVTGVDRNGGREVAHHHWRSAHLRFPLCVTLPPFWSGWRLAARLRFFVLSQVSNARPGAPDSSLIEAENLGRHFHRGWACLAVWDEWYNCPN